MSTLILRADANRQLGHGHAIRCLALAESWMAQVGQAMLVTVELDDSLHDRIEGRGLPVHRLDEQAGTEREAAQLVQIARQHQARWIVVDGYQFSSNYLSQLRQSAVPVLKFEDFRVDPSRPLAADLVLNQNQLPEGQLPEGLPVNESDRSRCLFGPEYAVLRSEFVEGSSRKRLIANRLRRVLISFGGTDQFGMAPVALRALMQSPAADLQIRVVAGRHGRSWSELLPLTQSSRFRVELLSDVERMDDLMRWADVAIVAAGSTCWEMARMGLPMMVIAVADNQAEVVASLRDGHAAEFVGWREEIDSQDLLSRFEQLRTNFARRCLLANNAQQLVDGRGAERVVQAMLKRTAA